MPNGGFEVELVLALTNLLKGQLLEPSDYQVIDCATEEEKRVAFEEVVSEILCEYDEQSHDKIKRFKQNMEIIGGIMSGPDPRIFSLANGSDFEKHSPADYDMALEKILNNLISGELLTGRDVLSICVADEIDLIDAFGYVLRNALKSRSKDFGENVDLNMYILKSLKLTSQAWFDGVNMIYSISRAECEMTMAKQKNLLVKT